MVEHDIVYLRRLGIMKITDKAGNREAMDTLMQRSIGCRVVVMILRNRRALTPDR
jgi:hypothetical protein